MQNNKYKFLKLIIAFIIILVVGIFLFNIGTKKMQERKTDDIKTDMLMIEGKIKSIKAESEISNNQEKYVGTKVSEANETEVNNVMQQLQINQEELQNYYILNKESFEKMGIADSIKDDDDEYIVNYTNSDVIYVKGIKLNNEVKYKKELWTQNEEGNLPRVYQAQNEYDEGTYIVEQMEHLRREEYYKYSDFAILYRMNTQSRAIEDILRREDIPYKIVGGLKFYERKEINVTTPHAERIFQMRNDIEHNCLRTGTQSHNTSFTKYTTEGKIENNTFRLLKLARELIIYLCLAVNFDREKDKRASMEE